MKRAHLALCVIVAWIAAAASAAVAEARLEFDRANQDYLSGRYESAIQRYEGLIGEFPHDAVLYYNLGNARHRAGERGQAVWCYEMALRLRPGWREAEHNLAIARGSGAHSGSLIGRPLLWARERVAPQAWSWTALWAWAAMLTAAGVALALDRSRWRTRLWRLTGVAGAVMVLALGALSLQRADRRTNPPSVVVADSVAVRSGGGPDLGSPMGSLPAGTHVWPVERPLPSGWVKIRTESGQLGFVDVSALRALTVQ